MCGHRDDSGPCSLQKEQLGARPAEIRSEPVTLCTNQKRGVGQSPGGFDSWFSSR